jgi:excisionase family DNA binding protein
MTIVDATFQYASVPEAAESLGMSDGRIRQLLINRTLKGHKIGQNWVIPAVEIERFRQIPQKTGRPRKGKNGRPPQ